MRMGQLISIIFIFCLLQNYSCEPYSRLQNLDEVVSPVYTSDISNNNQILAIPGNLIRQVMIYKLNASQLFDFDHSLSESTGNVFTVDITSDGKWLFATDFTGLGRVYEYSETIQQFQQKQQITIPGDNNNSFSGAITDDHEWVVLGKNNGKIYVFTFDGSSFVFKEVLQQGTQFIRHISMTNDHLYLAASTLGQNVYVYKYDGTNYTLLQTFNFAAIQQRRIFLADDHQYLTISDGNGGKASVYKYNEAISQFVLQKALNFLPTSVNIASLSEQKTWLGVSLGDSFNLYSNPISNSIALEQQISEPSNLFHKFSQDQKYLIIGNNGKPSLVYVNCNYKRLGSYFSQNTSLCQSCETGCIQCINSSYCEECNQNQNYYMHQSEQSCFYCEVGNNYFIQNDQCVQCQIQGCTTCSNSTHCSECEQGNLYGLSEDGQCCQIAQECHPLYWLFLFLIIFISLMILTVILVSLICYLKKRKKKRQPIDIKSLSMINSREL